MLVYLPTEVANNIKDFLSRLDYSGSNNFHEVRILHEICSRISEPATKEQIDQHNEMISASNKADD